jgi:hypothetical protein
MTVAPVPPALVALAAIRPEAPPVVPSTGASSAGLAQQGAAQLNTLETALPASPLPQIGTATALDALALKAAAQAAIGGGGLALLMADLSQALRIPGLPAPVQAAIGQILALRAPLNAAPTSADLKAALTPSNPSGSPQPAAASAPADAALVATALSSGGPLKNALLGLEQVLKTWLAGAPTPPASPSVPAASSPGAAPPQGGSAPIIADLVQALRASGLPAPVQAALLQALTSPAASSAIAAPTQPNIAPTPVQAGSAGPVAPATAEAPAETVPLPAADLAQPLPAAVDQGFPPLLGSAPTETAAPAPAAIGASGTPTAAEDPAIAWPADIKAALLSLPQTAPAPAGIAPSVAEAVASATTAAATAATAGALAETLVSALSANVDLRDVMLIFQQVFKTWFDGASAQSSSALAPPGSAQEAPANAMSPSNAPNAPNSPPPPYRGGPTTAQPAVPSTLPANTDPVAAGNRLLRETSAALAHQELLQIASLPAAPQGLAHSAGQNPQWMFEIPFATAQGSAIAQFKISRDGGKGGTKGGQAPVWRARFSLDVEPMGPVHAQIVLSGDRTWVSLWAEREESVARLRQNEALLTTSLHDANFVAEVAFHAGAPRQPATAGRQFLDHAS